MKRIILFITIILLVFTFSTNIYAFDFGGSLSSATDYDSADTPALTNEESLGLWLQSGRGEHYSFEMKLDNIFAFTGDGFKYYLHPDFLKLDSLYTDLEYGPSILATSIGRFTTSDFTGKVFSQKLDGMIWNLNYSKAELTVAAGTTAFIFSDNGALTANSPAAVMSKNDVLQAGNSISLFDYLADPAAADAAGKSLFASPRAVEMITLGLPQLFAKQDLNFSLVVQEDLRPMMDVINGYFDENYVSPMVQEGDTVYNFETGGAVDTVYIGTGISGSSIPSLYHNVFYYFGTGRALSYTSDPTSGYVYQYDNILSHMAGFSVDYFMKWFFNSKVGVAATFGSGDADAQGIYEGNTAGYYTQFTPISSSGGGLIFSSGISNMLTGNINYSIKPFGWLPVSFIRKMQVSAAYMPFFRVVDGPTAVSGISPDYTGNYLGSEIDLVMNLRPFSDLGIIIKAGYFMPDGDAFAGSAMADPVFKANLNVSLSF